MLRIVVLLVNLYLLVLLAYVVLSFVTAYAHLSYDSPVWKIQRVVNKLCDPVLNPIRRVIPPVQIGTVGLDVSVLVAFLLIEILVNVIL